MSFMWKPHIIKEIWVVLYSFEEQATQIHTVFIFPSLFLTFFSVRIATCAKILHIGTAEYKNLDCTVVEISLDFYQLNQSQHWQLLAIFNSLVDKSRCFYSMLPEFLYPPMNNPYCLDSGDTEIIWESWAATKWFGLNVFLNDFFNNPVFENYTHLTHLTFHTWSFKKLKC